MNNDRQLIVFARAPVLGKVKTRLATDIGAERALRVYRQLLQSALKRLSVCPCPKVLYADDLGLEDSAAGHGMALRRQSGADLGERMAGALHECLRDSRAVVLVGVDIPPLDAAYVESAFEKLESSDLVLGPTEDGGYCLIGMTRSAPSLFDNMPWGSENVCALTIAKAERAGLRVSLLPVLWDVDRASDLGRLDGLVSVDSLP